MGAYIPFSLGKNKHDGLPRSSVVFQPLETIGHSSALGLFGCVCDCKLRMESSQPLGTRPAFSFSGKAGQRESRSPAGLGGSGDSTSSLGILGTILLRQGKGGEAVKDLEQAIALNPRLVGARINLGEAFLSLGQTASAEQAFKSALRLAPDNFNARLDLA